MAEKKENDKRVRWLMARVSASLGKSADKKYEKAFLDESLLSKYCDFFDQEDQLLLVISENLKVDLGAPAKLGKGKHLLLWKVKPKELRDPAECAAHILLNELSGAAVHDFNLTLAEATFKAVLTNEANKERWGDVAQREMLEHYNKYLATSTILSGQIKGVTQLPMPTDGTASSGGGDSADGGSGGLDAERSAAATKQKLSMLEGAIITWTKQIRDVVRVRIMPLLRSTGHRTVLCGCAV
jgi:dynein heavy chain